MGWNTVGAVVVVLGMAPAAALGQTVTVRTYNHYGVAPDDLAAARPHVESIFAAAGIQVNWIDCWYRDAEVAGSAGRCRQAVKANEVVLRLQAANVVPGKRYVSMGFALVNVADGMPFLATVFADLVHSVSRDAHVDFRLLLGRAIAHEIGHLLLDNNRHPDRGLMRAGWSTVELRQNAEQDWTFGASEVAVLHTAAAVRTSTASRNGN
jgi:hypothetical protein